jgi:hypothetical protein
MISTERNCFIIAEQFRSTNAHCDMETVIGKMEICLSGCKCETDTPS